VALVITDVSEEFISSIFKVERISELRTTLAVTIKWTVFLRSLLQLLVTANVVPSSLIPSTLMMVAIRFPETTVLTKAVGRHISDDGIIHSDRYENLKSCVSLTGWTM
jgi:hypothetical protein